MDYYQTHDEIDEIGEGLIRKYQYQSFIQGTPTDIEDFIISNLGYRIVYDRIAEGDAGKMAFLADGKTALLLCCYFGGTVSEYRLYRPKDLSLLMSTCGRSRTIGNGGLFLHMKPVIYSWTGSETTR